MAGGSTWAHFVVLVGFLVVIAGLYTIRNPKRERGRALRLRNVDRDTVVEQLRDPERIRETRREGWFGLLLGLVFIAVGLAPRDDLRLLIAAFGLALPLLYVVATRPIRENVPVVVLLLLATGYGLLVVGGVAPGDLLAPLALVLGLVGVINLLAGNPLGAGSNSDQDTFRYRCMRCEHEFESSTVDMAEATCPECGATRVVTVARER